MSKLQKYFNNHRSEIIVGIIVFIITAIGNNLFHFVFDTITIWGGSFSDAIINSIYISASKQHSDSLLLDILTQVFYVSLVFFAGRVKKSYHSLANLIRLENLNKKLSSLSKEELKAYAISELKRQQNDTQKESQVKNDSTNGTTLTVVYSFTVLALIACLLCLSITIFVPNRLWHKFERDVSMIAPYVEQEQIIKMRSDWTCIQSKSDYERIYEFILQVKEENSLPK